MSTGISAPFEVGNLRSDLGALGREQGLRVLLALWVATLVTLYGSGMRLRNIDTAHLSRLAVTGDSMSPFLPSGRIVELDSSYYAYHPVGRDDLVVVQAPGQPLQLIKWVKAIPGDRLELRAAAEMKGWQLWVNGEQVRNREGLPYLLSDRNAAKIGQAELLFSGIIPAGAFLVLGNLVAGSLDSTQFGLIRQTQILGKARMLP